jgi:hypothetical protein
LLFAGAEDALPSHTWKLTVIDGDVPVTAVILIMMIPLVYAPTSMGATLLLLAVHGVLQSSIFVTFIKPTVESRYVLPACAGMGGKIMSATSAIANKTLAR